MALACLHNVSNYVLASDAGCYDDIVEKCLRLMSLLAPGGGAGNYVLQLTIAGTLSILSNFVFLLDDKIALQVPTHIFYNKTWYNVYDI